MKKNLESIHRLFTIMMLAAFAFGVMFFVTNNLDFLINSITFKKASFPNIMYWLTKNSSLILPIVFLAPSFAQFERIKAAKYSFITYGILHILSLSWIFMYIGANGTEGLFSNEAITQFQYNNLVYSYVYWDTYSWTGSIFAILYGAFCIYTGLNFDDDKTKVCNLTIAAVALRVVLPVLSNIFSGNGFLSNFWITNNCIDILSSVIFTMAIYYASAYDASWISLIWDHEVPQNDEDM